MVFSRVKTESSELDDGILFLIIFPFEISKLAILVLGLIDLVCFQLIVLLTIYA